MKRPVPALFLALFSALALPLLASCTVAPLAPALPPVAPAAASQEVAPARTPGSLWSDEGRYLFADRRARAVGDVLTVSIRERASASKEAQTESTRDSSVEGGLSALLGLERQLGRTLGSADLGQLLSAEIATEFKGKGKTSRKEDLVATLAAVIDEVLPNGNLRIHGDKIVTVNDEDQLLRLDGIVRPQDIGPGNVVASERVLAARIEYRGRGTVSDVQRQGWLMALVQKVWPF